MAKVEVIVPWRGGCGHRERAWAALRPRYSHRVIEAPGPTPWSKGAAIRPSLEWSRAEVVVIADADVWVGELTPAIHAVFAGAAWAIPHRPSIRRLSEHATSQWLSGVVDLEQLELARPRYEGVEGGGIFVTRRETLLAVPMDPRFTGWGQEDLALGFAMNTLIGPPWRGESDLVHLWHPPAPRLDEARGSPENMALYKRYRRANGDQDAMASLLEEARHALHHDALRAA